MKSLSFYLLISFIAISVFGFTGLTSHGSLFSQCVAATVPGGMPCTGNEYGPTMNIWHAKIFQSFSAGILMALSLLMLAFIVISLSTRQSATSIQLEVRNFEQKIYPSIEKYNTWLRFHQQHPVHA